MLHFEKKSNMDLKNAPKFRKTPQTKNDVSVVFYNLLLAFRKPP